MKEIVSIWEYLSLLRLVFDVGNYLWRVWLWIVWYINIFMDIFTNLDVYSFDNLIVLNFRDSLLAVFLMLMESELQHNFF